MSMFPKIRSNPWLKGLQFPECSGRRDTNNPPTTWQPSGQGLMAVVIWDLGSKEVTEALTVGPTSPRNQVVRKPKGRRRWPPGHTRAPQCCMCPIALPSSAPGPRLRPPHQGAPPGGPPRSASARSTPAEGTQEGLGFWPPVSGHSICVSSIPRQTIFSHLVCGISPHSLLHFLLFKICVYFCHTAQHVGS